MQKMIFKFEDLKYHKFVAGKMGIIEYCKTAQKEMVD
jgi:hypothetical protein